MVLPLASTMSILVSRPEAISTATGESTPRPTIPSASSVLPNAMRVAIEASENVAPQSAFEDDTFAVTLSTKIGCLVMSRLSRLSGIRG